MKQIIKDQETVNREARLDANIGLQVKQKKIPRFGSKDYESDNVGSRLHWLEEIRQKEFPHIAGKQVEFECCQGNIENIIGFAQVPIGLAGPLRINGTHANGEFYVPLATTEGAITTTYNIGMRLITENGGAAVQVKDKGAHVTPMFEVSGLKDATDFISWVDTNYDVIKKACEATTTHGSLISIESQYLDKKAILKFLYFTGDASGLNMINVATEAGCEFIKSKTGRKYNVRSNFSCVKKMSIHNVGSTFGKEVVAEAIISAKSLSKLGVTAHEIVKTWGSGLPISTKAGVQGFNCQSANAIAALFLATGQDVADISSSHIAYSHFEVTNENELFAHIYIPSLVIGTVGGGTGLGTQKEALDILDCYGTGKVLKLAEIIGASVLAGEITTICAITNNTFVQAHAKLGRNRPE